MSILSIISISLCAIFAENAVFSQLFGMTLFTKKSGSIRSAAGTGVAVAVSMAALSVVSWFLDFALISPLGLEYLRTVIFVLTAVCLSGLTAVALRKKAPELIEKMGISLPLVTVNTATLGAMLVTSASGYNIIEALVYGLFSGAGFLAAITLFAAIRERLEYSDIPKWLEGLPITFITAGLVALAFMGFRGISFM
ncbi:MAG: electron transport complex subunit RsxA [Oscillospiraceae bacterium]|nr:electron transport complex subunit RsxA [Oscillospiraceae bacterium]